MTAAQPFWLTVFIDFPASEFDAGTAFWVAGTGYARSPLRGALDEFATLVPAGGDEYVKVQRLGEGATRLHLDLNVKDPWAVAEAAESHGAELVAESGHGYIVLRSPAGLTFCLVRHPAAVVPEPMTWSSGHRSRVSQVCLDIPRGLFDVEVLFWQVMLAGEWRLSDGPDPFAFRRASGLPLELRLQPSDLVLAASGHLHLTTDDRAAEVDRLISAGAVQRSVRESLTVLEAPGGMTLCVLEAGRGQRR